MRASLTPSVALARHREELAPGGGMAVGMAADGGVGECYWLLGRWRGDGRLPGLLAGQIALAAPVAAIERSFSAGSSARRMIPLAPAKPVTTGVAGFLYSFPSLWAEKRN